MHRYFIPTLRSIAVLLAILSLALALPARAQNQPAQNSTQDTDQLRKDVAYFSGRVCGVTGASDAYKKALAEAANALIAALDQQKTTLKGTDFDTAMRKQNIDDEEKALKQTCPALPPALEKVVTAASGAAAVAPPAQSPTPLPQVTVTSLADFGAQTIGTKSDAKSVTVTNSSGDRLDLFVWYGTHLSNFKVSENTCDTWVPDKGNCSFKVTFVPLALDAPEERLRVVSRRDWEAYESVRRAYEDQGQAAVDGTARKVNEQRGTPVAGTQSAIDFCQHAKGGDPAAKACNDLTLAVANRDELQKNLKPENKKSRADVDKAANDLRDKALAVIPLSGTANHWKYPLTRGVVGLDLSAVSSQTVKQAYFVEFNLLAPFKFPGIKADQDALENRWWFWLNPRITSLPKAADFSSLSTISDSGSFFSNFSNKGTTSDIAQGFDVNGGIELALIKPRDGIPWWGEYVNTQARLGISLIGGGGIATPFSVDKTDITSQVNQAICDAFKAPAGTTVSGGSGLACTFPAGSNNPVVVAPNPVTAPGAPATIQDQFIDFVTPERSRFFRRYYGGFRLKTYFFSPDIKSNCSKRPRNECDAPYDIFPGIIDVTAGQDEAVTAGHLRHVLLRLEGVYPLPFYPGLHVFGTIYSALKSNHTDFPLNSFAINQPANGASNDFNTFRFAPPPLNRDYFRVGIGIDLIQLFKNNKGGQPTTTTSTPSSQGSTSGGGSAKPQGASGGGAGNP